MTGRNPNQLADVAGNWAAAASLEGITPAGHGMVGEIDLSEFNFAGVHPQNKEELIGYSAQNEQALAKHPGLVVMVQSGEQFFPAVTTVVRRDDLREPGFTRVPVPVDPVAPELSGGVLGKLKELQAQQDQRTGSAAYDSRRDTVDVAGHGGAFLLRVRDQLSGKQSSWTAHDSHVLAQNSGGFGIGIAAAGLYRQRMDGRIGDLPPPVRGSLRDHPLFIYSGRLDQAVRDAVGGVPPEAAAVAGGIVSVSSLTERPTEVVTGQLVRGLSYAGT